MYEGLRHMYLNSNDTTEWFMIIDDDTFVFTDTLLYTLDHYNATSGKRQRPQDHDEHMDGNTNNYNENSHLYLGNYNEFSNGLHVYGAFGGGGILLNRKLMRWVV